MRRSRPSPTRRTARTAACFTRSCWPIAGATRALSFDIAVPAAVRVEAGWDRTAAAWAFVNQLRIADIPLDARHADAAASIRQRAQVSVADAHLGAAIQGAEADHVTVITSDPRDIQRVA